MRIYDISQEVFGSKVFPGDPAPAMQAVMRIAEGGQCNLSAFSMCAHNGTHVDAPFHFYEQGKTIDKTDLERYVGIAYVAEHTGVVTANDAIAILQKARETDRRSRKRILIKGQAEEDSRDVHLQLLGAEVTLLEGIRLGEVEEGVYFLNAAPINLGGVDGAPCRAVLVELEIC